MFKLLSKDLGKLFLATAIATVSLVSIGQTEENINRGHAVSIFGEPKYGPDFEHFEYADPNAPKGGSIVVGEFGSFDSLHRFILKGDYAYGMMTGPSPSDFTTMFDTLTVDSQDEHGSTYGLLAGEIEWPEDRTWTTFTLRPEARFHDGTKVTAEDVVFSFDILREKGAPAFTVFWKDIEKAEALSEDKVKFTFKKSSRELPAMAGAVPVFPKHYWDGKDFAESSLDIPVGSGPYKIKEFEPGRFIEYELDPNYWGKDLAVNKGKFNIVTHRKEYFRELEIIRQAVRAGEIDIWQENKAAAWADGYDLPAVEQGVLKKEWIDHKEIQGMQAWYLNTRRDVFKNKALRQALNLAFDFEWTNATLFHSQYTRTKSFYENSDMASTGLPEGLELEILEKYRDQVPAEVFTQTYDIPVSDGSGKNRRNLGKALKILKGAGYRFEDKKLIDPGTNEQVAFEFLQASASSNRILNPWLKILNERLGMNASIRVIDPSQYLERLKTYDFDVISLNLPQSQSPGVEQYHYFGSEGVKNPGSFNFAGVNDPVVDELVEGLISATSLEEQQSYARALDRVLLWGDYVVPNWYLSSNRLLYWDKFDRPAVLPWEGARLEYWWIDAEKASTLEERKSALK
jgi:microcin C transport system substrate-binding protein